jgi:hypothetical protein
MSRSERAILASSSGCSAGVARLVRSAWRIDHQWFAALGLPGRRSAKLSQDRLGLSKVASAAAIAASPGRLPVSRGWRHENGWQYRMPELRHLISADDYRNFPFVPMISSELKSFDVLRW